VALPVAFQIKRVYEAAKMTDGTRVLIDRLWPRGVKKQQAHSTSWIKEVAPSARLRLWFGHKPEHFAEFQRRHKRELAMNPAVADLRKLGRSKLVTLVYAAHGPEINHAVVLQAFLRARRARATSRIGRKTHRRCAGRAGRCDAVGIKLSGRAGIDAETSQKIANTRRGRQSR
jgi:uncharacterized protein YeaO (DUF488 family)